MKKSLVANLYNPHEQSKDQLIHSFVVRRDAFQKLFEEIKWADITKPQQHWVIEGQRGMGKTTLLLRLSYEITNDPDLQRWLIPIVFKEEAYYGIRRLFRLWEAIAHELEEREKSLTGLTEQMSKLYDERADYEQACFERLLQTLEYDQENHTSKRLILFIDNLGEMLRNFSMQENIRLREILTTCPYLRIIGATPVVLEAALPAGHPFAHFFNTLRLESLNKEETRSLLLELATVYNEEKTIQSILKKRPGRVEALRILTGGVIRTMILLFEIFTESKEGEAVVDLDNILDKVTPLYQNRMHDLTPVQRDVVNAAALHWDAISPEEIARITRLDVAEVNATLQELERVFILQRVGTEPQQTLYLLQERFFNIWYLMRLAPGGSRSKVLWLLHFLESWYDQEELTQQARKYTKMIASGRYTAESAYSLTEAFLKTDQLDLDTEHQMIAQTRRFLVNLETPLLEELPSSDKELFEKAEEAYLNGDYEQAIIGFLQMKRKDAQIYVRLGDSFSKLTYYKDAIEYFLHAIELGHIDAMVYLGILYHKGLKDSQNAEKYFTLAAEKGHVNAMLQLGNFYYDRKEYQNAEQYYVLTVKQGRMRSTVLTSKSFSIKALKDYLVTAIKGETQVPEQYSFKDFDGTKQEYLAMITTAMTQAMLQLGHLYVNDLKNDERAAEYYAMAADTGNIEAMVHLGILYHYTLKDYHNAVKYYTMAVNGGEKNYAAVNLGVLYQDVFKDYVNAEKYYLVAAEQGDAGAMNGLAWLYFEQKVNKEEALEYARKSVETEKNIYTAHTAACIYLWNNQPEEAIQIAQEFMYDANSYKRLEQDILFYLMLLLAKKQYQACETYFKTPDLDLRERFKPIYYVFLYFIEHPNFQKLPPELAEPVQEIIKQTEQLAMDYA